MLFQTKEITVWVCFVEMPQWEWLAAAELVVILNRTGVLFRVYPGGTDSEYLHPPSSKCGHGSATPASQGILLQMLQPRPPVSESAFNKVLGSQ